jgi:DNA-binding NarL/FixJ family response regulator
MTEASPTSVVDRRALLVVFDPLELRRAALVSLLQPWGAAAGLEIVAADPARLADLPAEGEVRLTVVSLGAASLHEEAIAGRLAEIRAACPRAAVAVVSDGDDPVEALRALEAGVDGLLPAALAPEVAINALAFILGGGTFFPPEALRAVSGGARLDVADRRGRPGRCRQDLTPRQQEVLDLLRRGLSNKRIARELDMQESTVKVHVRQIMHKLGVSNRTQVALIAAAEGEAIAAAAAPPPAADAYDAASLRLHAVSRTVVRPALKSLAAGENWTPAAPENDADPGFGPHGGHEFRIRREGTLG